MHIGSGDVSTMKELLDRSVPVLKAKGRSDAAAMATFYRGNLHNWQSEYADAARSHLWSIDKARESGMLFSHRVAAHWMRGMALVNGGQVSDGLASLREGKRLAELNGERFWHARYPNTLGWIYREIGDAENALRLDQEGVVFAREVGFPEAEANSLVNLATDFLPLGEHARALECLQKAERLIREDPTKWLRWRFTIRLEAGWAAYWLDRGDLTQASHYLQTSLASAGKVLARKHMVWAHKLMADVAALEDRVEDAQREYDLALAILRDFPCPTIEWRVAAAAAAAAQAERMHDDTAHARYQVGGRQVIDAHRFSCSRGGRTVSAVPPGSITGAPAPPRLRHWS